MTPVGLSQVTTRISELQQRFAVPEFPHDPSLMGGAGGFVGTAGATAASAGGVAGAVAALDPDGQVAAQVRDAAAGAPLQTTTFSSASVTGPAGAAGAAGPAAPAGPWADRLPPAGARWAGEIQRAADSAGIDPRLLAALVQQESGFRPDARSHAGAIGLGQLMPGTARELGVNPNDPQQNLNGAARYLRTQLDRFGSVDLALAAYNAGPGRVAKAGGIPRIQETQQYVQKVTANYLTLRSA